MPLHLSEEKILTKPRPDNTKLSRTASKRKGEQAKLARI